MTSMAESAARGIRQRRGRGEGHGRRRGRGRRRRRQCPGPSGRAAATDVQAGGWVRPPCHSDQATTAAGAGLQEEGCRGHAAQQREALSGGFEVECHRHAYADDLKGRTVPDLTPAGQCMLSAGSGEFGSFNLPVRADLRRDRLHGTQMNFEEQIAELERGADEVLTRRRPREEAEARHAAAHQGGLRPDRARPAPRPHGAAEQDAPVPGARAQRHLPDRRLHRDDRRPVRAQRHAPAAHAARRSRPTPRPTRRRSSRSSTRTAPRSTSTRDGSASWARRT